MRIVYFLSYFIFASFAYSQEKIQSKLSSFEVAKYQYCGQDSDCIVAQNGCCDCANGGEDVAISKRHIKDFKARFNCLEAVCTELGSIPLCGSGTVSCISGKCVYVYPRE